MPSKENAKKEKKETENLENLADALFETKEKAKPKPKVFPQHVFKVKRKLPLIHSEVIADLRKSKTKPGKNGKLPINLVLAFQEIVDYNQSDVKELIRILACNLVEPEVCSITSMSALEE